MEEEEENEEDEDNEEEKEDDQEGNESEEVEQKTGDEDSSATNSDGPPFIRKTVHKYALRQREAKKFSNTMDTPLILTPSPPPSQQPTTPLHSTYHHLLPHHDLFLLANFSFLFYFGHV